MAGNSSSFFTSEAAGSGVVCEQLRTARAEWRNAKRAHATTGEQLPSDAIAVFVRRDLHREPRNPNLNGATPFGRHERVAPCWSASA